MHARVFGVVTSRQLAFGFGKVERTTVTLGIAGYQINHESYQGRHMSAEYIPAFGSLLLHNFRNLHGAAET